MSPAAHKIMRQDFHAPQDSPKVLAVYMSWFGDRSHMDVGYSSHSPEVLRRQIQEARKMGISAFVVDWYGDSRPFIDRSFALLQQLAVENHFQVALLYNEPEDDTGQATEETMAALDKAYNLYIGSAARYRAAYLTYNGRPMLFIFPKRGLTNWDRVREHLNSWSEPPLLFYKDEAATKVAADFAGYYAWVQPGQKMWAADGSNWGEQYLENFYQNMRQKHSDKIAVGAAWPGFDDTGAPWGLNRHMDRRCGETFEETLSLFRRYYDDLNPLPFLLVETWNDYEEGTAIERRVFAGCTDGRPNGPASSAAPSGSGSVPR